jgi:hypothetical protein
MFFSDYDIDGFEGQDHVFTQLQKDTRQWIDQNIYGIINSETKTPLPQQQDIIVMKTKTTTTSTSTKTPSGIDKDNPSNN